MARIPLPENGNLEIMNALALARPELTSAYIAFDAAISGGPIDARVHELVRMRIAQINDCTVCMAWRRSEASEAGVTDDLLTRVDQYRELDELSVGERVAIEFAERFSLNSAQIDDDLLRRLGEHFTPADIVELTLLIGKYVAFGRFMQVLDLDQSCALDFQSKVSAPLTPV